MRTRKLTPCRLLSGRVLKEKGTLVLRESDIRLADPDFYHDNPHPIYEKMREEAPLYWYKPKGFWVATRYDDIQYISKASDKFSVESGVLLTDILQGIDAVNTMYPDGVENFFTSDPPRHNELRNLVSFAFNRQRLQGMQSRVTELVSEYLQQIIPGDEIEFVSNVSVPLPIAVIAEFMDLDDLSIDDAYRWSEAVFKMGADVSEEELRHIATSLESMVTYFTGLIESRQTQPKDDFIGRLVASELDEKRLVSMMVVVFCQTIMVAGNETTRNGISSAIKLFADYPDQYRRLLEDETLIDSAVEEVLRFHNPTIGFMRTATCDTEIRDTKISAGEHVYLIYGAGNRDPDVFSNPHLFDIQRFRKPFPMHLTFGFGEHVCMGAALARLEMRAVLRQLRNRFSKIQLTATPSRPRSLLGNGFVTLPVVFTGH